MSELTDYPRYAQRRLSQRAPGARGTGRSASRTPSRPYTTAGSGATELHRRLRADATERARSAAERHLDRGELAVESVAPGAAELTAAPADGQSFLTHELGRLREQQERPRGRRILRRPRTRWGMVALAAPLLLLVAIAAIVGPVVYRGTRAYQQVFVEPVPRKPIPIAVRNAEGTAVIVMATEPGAEATEAIVSAPEPTPTTVPKTETTVPKTETPVPVSAGSPAASPIALTPSITPTPTLTPTPSITPTATSTPGEIPKWNGTGRLTMLLMGVDRREEEPSRSDTMILVNVDPVTKTANMIAIPRDLRVIIPGYGIHKVNAAYAFGEADGVKGGGPALVIQTIETNFGVHIDYFAEVDFAGFVKIVDTVGGITIDVPYPIKDDAYPASGNNYMRVYFPAGWQHLDGERALQYARTRHDDGDEMRSVRQQQVLMALRGQAVSLNLLTKAGELLGELGDAVRTDLSPTQALQLARLGTELSADGIQTLSLNPAMTVDDSPDGYYLDADWDMVGQILSKFAGVEITPPMSALTNPRLDAPIRIEDGTGIDGLGERAADVLRERGFTDVSVVVRDEVDPTAGSLIATNESDVATAFLVAGLIGVDLDAIALRPQAAPTRTPPTPTADIKKGSPPAPATKTPKATVKPDPDKNGIVISLGADARDPADFTGEPFQDDTYPVGQRKGEQPTPGEEPTIETGG